MTVTVEAVYEKGVLLLDQLLPFQDRERVRVSVTQASEIAAGSLPREKPSPEEIEERVQRVRESAGMLRWTGDIETLNYLTMDPDNHPWET